MLYIPLSVSPLREFVLNSDSLLAGVSDYAEIVEEDSDYSNPTNRDYELERGSISLECTLGEGQFGDVYRGVYVDEDGVRQDVAVKTCKVSENEDARQLEARAEKFLGEACKCRRPTT